MNFFRRANTSKNIETVNASTLKKLLEDKNVQLVDVRTADEYAHGTIQNAILIDVFSANFADEVDKKLDPTRPVAVFCHSGARSMQAAHILAKKNFPIIYNLQGGILLWR